MTLLSLPREILIMIIDILDIKSVFSLYNTCSYLRSVICMHGVVKECALSLGCLANTREIFKTMFFRDISSNLEVLNVCGIPNLSKTHLIVALKRLKNLKHLDVSYTNITLDDMIDVQKVCKTIKKVAINMVFNQSLVDKSKIHSIKNTFKNFEEVHFIVCYFDLMYGTPSFFVHSNLKEIVLTVTRIKTNPLINLPPFDKQIVCHKIKIIFPNWGCEPTNYTGIIYLSEIIDLNKYEYIILKDCGFDGYTVVFTSLFNDFVLEKFGINTNKDLVGIRNNCIAMMWSKETQFNASFFSHLHKSICKYLPANFKFPNPVDRRYSSNCFLLTVSKSENDEIKCLDEPLFKKKRSGCENYYLDYDDLLKNTKKLQLKLRTVSLNASIDVLSEYQYLKQLTSLNLTAFKYYATNFFKTLFESCIQLETLNIENDLIYLPIPFTTHLPSRIKNLRIVHKIANFGNLFLALSRCKLLENIIILSSSPINGNYDPSIIIKECKNLYNFYLIGIMNESTNINLKKICRTARSKYNMDYLNAEIYSYSMAQDCTVPCYKPYLGVFNLTLIKPE